MAIEQYVAGLKITMQNPVLMRVLHRARYLGHKPDAFARFIAHGRLGLLQAAASRVFHAEERQPVFSLTHFVYGKNIRVIKTGSGFSLTPETFQRISRISVIRPY